jgi:hypothetical protein
MICTTLLFLIFSFEIFLICQNSIQIYQNLKFKFQIIQMNLDEEMTKTKIVDLNKFYNFVVYNFFHLKSFSLLKFGLKFLYIEVLINYMKAQFFFLISL